MANPAKGVQKSAYCVSRALISRLFSFLPLIALALFVSFMPTCAVPPSPPNDTPPFLALAPSTADVPADGVSSVLINVSVWDGTSWVWFGLSVDFSADAGEITTPIFIENGTATAILTAGTEPGVATITAAANLGGGLGILTNITTVTFTWTEFDTGPGTYPCIPGVYEGIIIPNQTMTVNFLDIYSAPGTGGRARHAIFFNTTTGEELINTTMLGYQGSFSALRFPEELTLVVGETYGYEIVTDSYPQAIHKQNTTSTDGSFIACTYFRDANGKDYSDWIPAFRLGP